MSNTTKYIENVAVTEDFENDDVIETITINEAFTACKLQELETLQSIIAEVEAPYFAKISKRIADLQKELRNIKF